MSRKQGSGLSSPCFYRWIDELYSRISSSFIYPCNGQWGDIPRRLTWFVRFNETLRPLNIHPGSLRKWLHAYQRMGFLVLEETDAFDAGAVITRRAGINPPPFGAVKRQSAPRRISSSPPWLAYTSPCVVYLDSLDAILFVVRSRCRFVPQRLRFSLSANFRTLVA